MREIKFRGYNKENKKWLESMTIMKNNEKYYMVVEELQTGGILRPTLPVEEASIGQYTGFKDKNGVEIYEGDIVIAFERANKYKVVFSEYHGAWSLECIDAEIIMPYLHGESYEVIGNIYEEKLKEDK